MKGYIDHLLLGHTTETSRIEQAGFAVDIIPWQDTFPVHAEARMLTVNARRLFDYFTLRDTIEVPIWSKVDFITDGQRLIPRHFVGALAQAMNAMGESIPFDPNATWRRAHVSDLQNMGLTPDQVTTGLYRGRG